MPNPRLTKEQNASLFVPLLAELRARLIAVAGDDPNTLWALRRKLAKELVYDERGTPAHRIKLKKLKRQEQGGKCALCGTELPNKGAELDRFEAVVGYIPENTRLVCHECHVNDQEQKRYS